MEEQITVAGQNGVFGCSRTLSFHGNTAVLGNSELVFSGENDNILMETDPLDDGSTTYITLPLHFLQDNSILEAGSSHNFIFKNIAGNTVLLDGNNQLTILSGGSSQVVLSAEGLLQDGESSVFESEVILEKNKDLEKNDITPGLGIDITLNGLENGDVSIPNGILSNSFNMPPPLPSSSETALHTPQLVKQDQHKVQKRGPGRPRRDESEVEPPIGKGPFSCNTCSKEFDKWAQLKRHIKCHSDDKPFLCSECPASFNVEANLKLHKATHNVGDPRCPECDKKFSRVASLKAHVMLHEKEESLFCPDCGDEFSTQSQLDNHKTEHLEEWKKSDKLYQCRQCHREFTRASTLREHMREHYKVKASLSHKCHKRNIDRTTFIHKCDICYKCFQKPSQLIRHKRIHTGERPYKCELCSRAFNQKGSLQIHMSKHNGFKPFRCDFCSAMFSQKGNLRAHILRVHTIPHSGEQVYKCMECPCVFKKLGSLNAHMSRMHYTAEKRTNVDLVSVNVNAVLTELQELREATEEKSKPSDAQTDADILQQALVNSGLSGKEQQSQGLGLEKQGQNHTVKEEPLKTRAQTKDSCSTNYITLADKALDGSVRRYIIRQRRIGNIRWHQCSYCSKEFKKPSDLVRHIRIHTHERPYKCHHCFRSFAVKSTLTAHIRTHTGVKDYTCYVCLKKFSSSSSLKVHIRMHTGNKPFQCHHCDMTFRTTGHHKVHMLCHAKDGSTSRRKSSRVNKENLADLPDVTLQEPIIITENGLIQQPPQSSQVYLPGNLVSIERPYKCIVCCAGFRKSSHLKQHMLMHTGERPFKCMQCGKCFISNAVLKAHLRTHEGLKIFKCLLCNNLFSTNGSLKRHMHTHSDTRPFMCPYCHKTFKTSMNCRKHMKIHRQELALQAAQQARNEEKVANTLSSGLDSHFPPDGLGPDFSQAFSDQPFNIVDVEQQESDFAQNTLVQSLATGNLVDNSTLPTGASVITHTLHADASGTITLPSLTGQHALTQENIREIERTLNEQIFGTTDNDPLVDETGQTTTLTLSADGNDVQDEHSDIDSTTTEDLARTLAASPQAQGEPLIHEKTTENNKGDPTDIFVNSFETHGFESCVFSPITLQSDPLALDGLSHRATITTNLASILPPPASTTVPMLPPMEVNLNEVETDTEPSQERENDARGEEGRDIEVEVRVEEEDPLLGDDGLDPNSEPRPYQCNTCERGFKKLCHLKDHVRTHTGEKLFPCTTCDQKCASVSALRAHLKTHSGEKDFTCQICECRFRTNGSLSRHMVVHSNKRPFKCSMCEAQFRTANQVRRHIKLHEPREKKGRVIARDPMQARGRRRAAIIRLTAEETQVLAQQPLENATSVSEKVLISSAAEKDRISEIKDPHQQYSLEPLHANQCKYCPKSFRKPSDLVRHIRIHTGERPYRCSCCNKCFTVKSTLDSHMKTHSGEKLCACHVCGCLFATKGSLKVHMRLHTGAKPFKCPLCDLRFRTSGHRKAHLISHMKEASNSGKGQKSTPKRRKGALAMASSEIPAITPEEEIPPQQITLDQTSLGGLIPLPSTTDPFSPASLLGGTDGNQVAGNLQLQLNDGLQIAGVDTSGTLLTTQSLQLDESILQQLQASNIIIHSTVPGEGIEDPSESIENTALNPSLDSGDAGEVSAIIRFEIHTDENGQILNIQPAIEDGSNTNNIIFNVGEGLDMDVVEPEPLPLPDQASTSRFRVTDSRKGGRSLVAIANQTNDITDNIQDPLEIDDDFLVFHDCETCGKRFSKPSQLERHNRIHTGERPFECHICHKKFNQKNSLNTHLKSHTGERPFPCPHCDFTFTQKGNMKTHMRRVHRFCSLDADKQTPPPPPKSVLKAKQPSLNPCSESVGKCLEQVVSDLFPQMENATLGDGESTNN